MDRLLASEGWPVAAWGRGRVGRQLLLPAGQGGGRGGSAGRPGEAAEQGPEGEAEAQGANRGHGEADLLEADQEAARRGRAAESVGHRYGEEPFVLLGMVSPDPSLSSAFSASR